MENPIYSLWKSWCTVFDMLKDRGYVIPDSMNMSHEDFREWLAPFETKGLSKMRNEMTTVIDASDSLDSVMLFWKESIGTADLQSVHEVIKNDGVNHAIVIYSIKITPYAAIALRSLKTQKIVIETFTEMELQYNITKHVDVPRHIVCSSQKKAEIFSKYNVHKGQIPEIKVTDPVCRYYNIKPGQLVKILRSSESIPDIMVGTTKKELIDISYRIAV